MKEYVQCLDAGKYVLLEEGNVSLIHNSGHLAPRVNKEGKVIVTARDNMWRTMKMLESFNAESLARHATTENCPVSTVDAKSYVGHLARAGYLQIVCASKPGTKALYTLKPAMRTGPHAPMVQRTKVVFDPNLQRIVWHEGIEP